MALFGSFESEREIYSGGGCIVYSARKAGDPRTEYVIKVFALLPTRLDTEPAITRAPLLADVGQACLERIAVQGKAAAASNRIAPVLASGQDDRGVWYVMPAYPRSVEKIISGRVELSSEALQRILTATARAALDMKRACGRSHGDIQPAHVLISRSETLAQAEVVLSDPRAGNEAEADRFELLDLRAIGRIMVQLVLGQHIDEDDVLIFPVLASPEWSRLFGVAADRWLALCNRLLHPNLSVRQFSLEQLVEQLDQLRARRPISSKAILAAAAVFTLLGVAVMVGARYFNRASVLITSDPPGAEIKVTEADGRSRALGKTGDDGTPLKVVLPKGRRTLRAEYAGLLEQTASIEAGRQKVHRFVFPYGRVQLSSTPTGAMVEFDGERAGQTPYSSPILKPGEATFSLAVSGQSPTRVTVLVPSDGTLVTTNARLAAPAVASGTVEFDSQPRKARILQGGIHLGETPLARTMPPGTHPITAHFEDWPPVTEDVVVRAGEKTVKEFYLPHGTAHFKVQPETAKILVDGKVADLARKPLPPGTRKVRIEQPGYQPYETTIAITEREVTPLSVALTPALGVVEITTDPPGAAIFDTKAPDRELGRTQAGQPLRQNLQAGHYSFMARFDGLEPATSPPIQVSDSAIVPVRLRFDFAAAQFESDPPGAELLIATKKVKAPFIHYQKPGPVAYRAEMEHYEPLEGRRDLTGGATTPIRLRLQPKAVPLVLRSEPPGAEYYLGATRLKGTNDIYRVPWGRQEIVARYRGLEPKTNVLQVDPGGGNFTNIAFDYATVELTNAGTRLLLTNEVFLVGPGAVHLKPDVPYTFVLEHGGNRTNLPLRLAARQMSRPALPQPNLPAAFTNSLGMVLVHLSGMPKYPQGFWVGKYEVTEGEFTRLMGSNVKSEPLPMARGYWRRGVGRTNAFKFDAAHPQVMVTPQQALAFCTKLTEMDKLNRRLPPGMDQYALPAEEEWEFFAADAGLDDAITSFGRNPPRTKPEPVGLNRRPNRHGLYDVRGNVWEICLAADNSAWMRGGAYDSVMDSGVFGTLALGYRNQVPPFPSAVVGFRVICVPSLTNPTAQKN